MIPVDLRYLEKDEVPDIFDPQYESYQKTIDALSRRANFPKRKIIMVSTPLHPQEAQEGKE